MKCDAFVCASQCYIKTPPQTDDSRTQFTFVLVLKHCKHILINNLRMTNCVLGLFKNAFLDRKEILGV